MAPKNLFFTTNSMQMWSSLFLAMGLFSSVWFSEAASEANEDLTITFEQKNALDQFRDRVKTRNLTEDFTTKDIYLLHWLRGNNFNVEATERKYLNTLEWRKTNEIDKIGSKDWSDFTVFYPYTTEVYDKEGRPTFVFTFGEWDIRRAAVTGQTQKFLLYWAKIMEELMVKVRNLQASGQSVTQSNFLIDIQDYNMVQHGCPQCVSVYVGLIYLLRERYPGEIHRAYLVNAPRVFEVMMQILRPFMGENVGEAFKVYGNNKKEWGRKLLQDFSLQELPTEFGGSKKLNGIEE